MLGNGQLLFMAGGVAIGYFGHAIIDSFIAMTHFPGKKTKPTPVAAAAPAPAPAGPTTSDPAAPAAGA